MTTDPAEEFTLGAAQVAPVYREEDGTLDVADETVGPVRPRDGQDRAQRPRLSAHRAEELTTEYDIPLETVEAVADAPRQ